MALTLTKTDVQFDELRARRVLDPDGVTLRWFVTVGYDIATAEGETIHRDRMIEITNATQKTSLLNLLAAVKTLLKAQESIP